jgi:hypothetical protein
MFHVSTILHIVSEDACDWLISLHANLDHPLKGIHQHCPIRLFESVQREPRIPKTLILDKLTE